MYEVRWREHGEDGPWLGTKNLPRAGSINIGRDEHADLHLGHSSVSRSHAKIIIENNEIKIADAGSTNGTFLDGEQLDQSLWGTNNVLFIGPYELHLYTIEVEPIPISEEVPHFFSRPFKSFCEKTVWQHSRCFHTHLQVYFLPKNSCQGNSPWRY